MRALCGQKREASNLVSDYEKFDRSFAVFQAEHPSASFAQFYAHTFLERIRLGNPTATLGPVLKDPDRHLETRATFAAIVRASGLEPRMRVIEYGCGTLRLGRHFIRYLRRRNFMGYDVIPEFLDMGRQSVGPALLGKRKPALHVIDPGSLPHEGIAFRADLVVSIAVSFHVHPGELDFYLQSLSALTHHRLVLGVNLGPTFRYGNVSWRRPLETYVDGLRGLRFVRMISNEPHMRRGHEMTRALLEFARE
jgi:SAM-dependent methyltransferase